MSLPLASGHIPSLAPGDRPVNWAVTGRFGGRSSGAFAELNLATHVGDAPDAVVSNRAIVAGWAGAAEAAFVHAVHGADVVWVDSPGEAPVADVVLTEEQGLPVIALGADCAVVGLAAPGIVGVVHCGWRGLVAGVVPAAIAAIRARTSGPISAVLGPAICVRCYVVGPDCADQVRQGCPGAVRYEDPPRVDLLEGVRAGLGPQVDVIDGYPACTFESPNLFSHRRDQPTGRHGLMMWR